MNVTRRTAAVGGLSLLAGTSVTTLSRAEWGELNLGEGLEDFWLATDAYIYGYPLVTMEMTRRVMTNVAAAEGTHAPMGQFIKLRQYPNASFRDVTAPERRHALHHRLARRRQGAVGAQHSRHEGPLFPDSRCSTAGPPCSRCPASAPPAPARRPMRSPARAGPARCRPASRNTSRRPTSSGCSAASTAPARRRTTRPCTRCRTQFKLRAAQRLRQALHAAGGQGRSVDRHEDRRCAIRSTGWTRSPISRCSRS